MLNILLKDIAQKDNLSIESSASLKTLVDLMNVNQKGVVVVLEALKPIGSATKKLDIYKNN